MRVFFILLGANISTLQSSPVGTYYEIMIKVFKRYINANEEKKKSSIDWYSFAVSNLRKFSFPSHEKHKNTKLHVLQFSSNLFIWRVTVSHSLVYLLDLFFCAPRLNHIVFLHFFWTLTEISLGSLFVAPSINVKLNCYYCHSEWHLIKLYQAKWSKSDHATTHTFTHLVPWIP